MNYYDPRYGAPSFTPPVQQPLPQPVNYARPIRKNANIVCGALLIMMLVSVFVSMALASRFVSPCLETGLSGTWKTLLTDIVTMAASALSFWLACFFARGMLRMPRSAAYPMRRPKWSIAVPAVFVCLGTSIIGSYLVSLITMLCESAFGTAPTMPDLSAPVEGAGIVTYLISLSVLPAVFEELVFRGVILQSLRRFGDLFALIVSSFLFAVAHGNLIQGPNAMLMGLMIGYFVLRTGSLITGMIIHFVNNLFAGIISLVSQGLSSTQMVWLNGGVTIGYLVAGIVCIAILMLTQKNMFQFPPSSYPLGMGRRLGAFLLTPCTILFLLLMGGITITYFTLGG